MIIIGCDFHTRFEQIAMLDTETGELVERRLDHESGEARRFYAGLKEPALVGIESTGYTIWFAEMLAELGHELAVGEAGKIRAKETRKQKHDRRDAQHVLNLLVRGDFPRIWLPSAAERDVRVLLEHRHQLVETRTRAKNGLQATALAAVECGGPGRTAKASSQRRKGARVAHTSAHMYASQSVALRPLALRCSQQPRVAPRCIGASQASPCDLKICSPPRTRSASWALGEAPSTGGWLQTTR